MSFLNWFSGKGPAAKTLAPAEMPVQQRNAFTEAATADSAETRNQRHAKREHLYLIIRESMTHSGVLSGSYKFKVLSVDPQGAEFMVMMDMSADRDENTSSLSEQFNEMEALIIQSAWSRFEVTVLAVYWRTGVLMPSAAAANSAKSHPKQPAPVASALTPLRPSGIQPLASSSALQASAARVSAAASMGQKKPAAPAAMGRFDPIEEDEFSAFKAAMKAASRNSPGSEATSTATPKTREKAVPNPVIARLSRKALPSYTLLTGFEETQLPDPGAHPEMSRTQYGDLR